ncbi:uncharacterized protein SAPINGB_P002382 [Magnusiomyces paraingens]|uniref:Cas1p 10 TM acyl transferase domain-containing protein n=1 Tax=Magnusiomyces paraingens TaxID=2606893 RepID=A0A5E8BDL9_9ASCO|nr:uncharacterized protein SAPINGB_P002382 [Saprochaete ingens]VVT49665.1 unnamed protein product [Saprochaete ingens]
MKWQLPRYSSTTNNKLTSPFTKYSPFLLPLIVLSAAISWNLYSNASYSLSSKEPPNCSALLKRGRYLDDTSPDPLIWQPDGCAMRSYDQDPRDLLKHCLSPTDQFVFMGDSTARGLYWGVSNVIERGHFRGLKSHSDVHTTIKNMSLSFYWNPLLEKDLMNPIVAMAKGTPLEEWRKNREKTRGNGKRYLVVTGGLWMGLVEETPNRTDIVPRYARSLDYLFSQLDNRTVGSFDKIYFAPLLLPASPYQRPVRRDQLSPDFGRDLLTYGDQFFGYERSSTTGSGAQGGVHRFSNGSKEVSAYYLPVINELFGEHHYANREVAGMHFMYNGIITQGNILLNHICNEKVAAAYTKQDKPAPQMSCCVHKDPRFNEKLVCLLIAVVSLGLLVAALFYRLVKVPIANAAAVSLAALIAGAYSLLVNNSTPIALIKPHFSPTDMCLLLQLWAAITWFSLKPLPLDQAVLSEKTALSGVSQKHLNQGLWAHQLKGVFMSLLLIINVTGYDKHLYRIEGELLARVLLSLWSCVDLVDFSRSLRVSRTPRPVLLRLMRVSFLPLILFVSGSWTNPSASLEDRPSFYLSANNFWCIPLRVIFWYVFTLLGQPLAERVVAKGFGWAPVTNKTSHLKSLVLGGFGCMGYALCSRWWWWWLTGFSFLAYDFWLLLAALVWEDFFSATIHSQQQQQQQQQQKQVLRVSIGIMALVGINSLFISFGSYYPLSFGMDDPSRQCDFSQNMVDAAVSARGRMYTRLVHFFICIPLFVCLMSYSSHFYSPFWVSAGTYSYEILVLRLHIILAKGGSLLVHVFPTGWISSRFVLRALQILPSVFPKGFNYDYGMTLGVGKGLGYGFEYIVGMREVWVAVRRVASLMLVVWVAATIAKVYYSGWSLEDDEEDEFEDNGV